MPRHLRSTASLVIKEFLVGIGHVLGDIVRKWRVRDTCVSSRLGSHAYACFLYPMSSYDYLCVTYTRAAIFGVFHGVNLLGGESGQPTCASASGDDQLSNIFHE